MEKDGCKPTEFHQGDRIKNWIKIMGYKYDYHFAEKLQMDAPVLSRELQKQIIPDEFLDKLLAGLGISKDVFDAVDPFEYMRSIVGKIEVHDNTDVTTIGNNNVQGNYETINYRDPETLAIIEKQIETLNQEKADLEKKLDAEKAKSEQFAEKLAALMDKLMDKL